jgi:hypothetical protein
MIWKASKSKTEAITSKDRLALGDRHKVQTGEVGRQMDRHQGQCKLSAVIFSEAAVVCVDWLLLYLSV